MSLLIRLHLTIFQNFLCGTFIILFTLLLPINVTNAGGEDPSQTLKQQLDTTSAGFAERAPPEVIQSIEEAIIEVGNSGILENALKTGDQAPDFELPDATGIKVRLSELLKNGPVIIAWYRGNW